MTTLGDMAKDFPSCCSRSYRGSAYSLCLVLVLLSFPARAAENTPDQSSPQAVITTFFSALKANDNKTLIQVLSPKRKERAEDAEYWKGWLDNWRQYEVVKFFDPATTVSSDYEETLLVSVEYKSPLRPNFKNTIRVSRVGKIWYWDEN